MTTTENRPASRELDALIAEKVMGWSAERIQKAEPYIDESGAIAHDLPPYSTDIAAAWEVLTRFSLHFRDYREGGPPVGVDWEIGRCEPGSTFVYCKLDLWNGDGYDYVVEKADTAPLAICLAALKAVEKT